MRREREELKRNLVKNIKKYREQFNLTQEQAAERAEMNTNYWARLELVSQSDLPSLPTLSKIAKGLGVPAWKLLKP